MDHPVLNKCHKYEQIEDYVIKLFYSKFITEKFYTFQEDKRTLLSYLIK